MRFSIVVAALFSTLAIAAPIARPGQGELSGISQPWQQEVEPVVTGKESTSKNTAGQLLNPTKQRCIRKPEANCHHSRRVGRRQQTQHQPRL